MTPIEAAVLERFIVAAALLLGSAEDIIFGVQTYGASEILSARSVERFRKHLGIADVIILQRLRTERAMRLFFGVRMGLAASLMVPWSGYTFSLLGLCILQFILARRLRVGLDGSDQMTSLLLVALTIQSFAPLTALIVQVFIALQLTIAYLTAGVAKLVSKDWRGGQGLRGVMGTALYGSRSLRKVLDYHPLMSVGASACIYGGQIVADLSFILGGPWTLVGVALAVLFHLSVALIMRLTGFLLTFGACLPSVVLYSNYGVRKQFLHLLATCFCFLN